MQHLQKEFSMECLLSVTEFIQFNIKANEVLNVDTKENENFLVSDIITKSAVVFGNDVDGNDKESINKKIHANYDKIISEINENSNIQMIIKNKDDKQVESLLDDLFKDHKEQSNLRKIESLEQKLINNMDENSYSELIKLKSQINRD